MALQAGIVQSLSGGKFFAKDINGNTREIKSGDVIYENDTVFGDSSNSKSAKAEIVLAGNDIIVLQAGQKQLIDPSLIETAYGNEELFFTTEAALANIDAYKALVDVESDLRAAAWNDGIDGDITDAKGEDDGEVTAGEEEAEDEDGEGGGRFAARDGDMTDIESDLRKKGWLHTKDYREVENNKNILDHNAKELGKISPNPFENPSRPTEPTRPHHPDSPNKPDKPDRPTSEVKDPEPTPDEKPPFTPPIDNEVPAELSIDDVVIYESDGKLVFTVTLDKPLRGDVTFSYKTSSGTATESVDYVGKNGTITIPKGQTSVIIEIDAKDDYLYENSEFFNIDITNVTGNAKAVKPHGTGTILDNPPATKQPIDNSGNPDSETGTYGPEDTVYVKIVNNATTIEDMAGITGVGLIEIDGVKNDGVLEHFLQLVDKDGKPVEIPDGKSITVTLEYSSSQGTIDDTDFDNTREIEITLTKDDLVINHDGTLSYKITNHAIIETGEPAEELESYNLKITDIRQNADIFENIVIHENFDTVTGTIIDVTPLLENVTTPEDIAKTISLTETSKTINKMLVDNGTGFVEVSNGETVDLYDNGEIIGTITYDQSGKKFTFTPNEDYSNYKNADDIKFMYFADFGDNTNEFKQVKVQVTPVADAPTVTVNDVTTYEDNQNTQEGQHKIALELKTPALSKDQTDKNGADGDHPERNGEITLKFTNGNSVSGAKLFKADGTELATINTANQLVKVVIVDDLGNVDYDYHHKDVTTGEANTLYLTKTEYENLKIQHAEDNDTDIKINISVTSYELDDDDKPLTGSTDYSKSTSADMTVVVLPVTDDISIKWDSVSQGTYTEDGKTYTFSNIDKAKTNTLDIKAIMSPTSGAQNGAGGSKGDLDGTEKRTYIVDGLPTGTKVIIGGQSVTVGADGKATVILSDTNNKSADPDFKITLPEYYQGTVEATITLKVVDKGVEEINDSSKWGVEKTDTVDFKINVMPTVIPDTSNNTISIAQAIGDEDAGRANNNKVGNGNSVVSNANITNPESGLKLVIEPKGSELGKKGETATIWIDGVPVGGSMYIYDNDTEAYKLIGVEDGTVYEYTKSGSEYTTKTELSDGKTGNITVSLNNDGTYKVEILDYQNSKLPYFIPPHNDDKDYTFQISGEKVSTAVIDGQTVVSKEQYNSGNTLGMSVIVKNKADEPIDTEFVDGVTIDGEEYIVATEDRELKLADIYKNPPSSYDSDSEVLSIKIILPDGATISMKNDKQYKVFGNEYVVTSDDLDDVVLTFPKNFSGKIDPIKLTYVTTEKSGENDSKTHFTQDLNIFVKPDVDGKLQTKSEATEETSANYIKGTGDNANKSFYKLDLGVIDNDGDTNEYIDSVKFTVPTNGYELYIKNSDDTFTKIDSSNNQIPKANLGNIYVQVDEHFSGDVAVDIAEYVIKDKTTDNSDEVSKTVENYTHTLTIKPVTDKPTITVDETTATTSDKVTIDSSDNKIITISGNGAKFTVKVNTTSDDKDSSEEVQRIEITGVPKGVEIEGARFEGYKGGSGVWVIDNPTDRTLDDDGAFTDIKFIVHNGDDFDNRTVTIKTFTKDGTASENDNLVNIILKDTRDSGDKGGNGTDVLPDFTLKALNKDIFEDMGNKVAGGDEGNPLILGDLFDVVNYTVANPVQSGYNWAVTFTDIPDGSEVMGLNGRSVYSYKETVDGVEKTFYVVSGTTDTSVTPSDIKTELNNVQIILPKDVNSKQDAPLQSDFNITGTISVTKGGSSYQSGDEKIEDREITPVTDEMTITVTADNIDEDAAAGATVNIKLENPSDGTKTVLGDTITITVVEDWKDVSNGATVGGDLSAGASGYSVVKGASTVTGEKVTTTYTITNSGGNFELDGSGKLEINNLKYQPAEDRDGNVTFEVKIHNQEKDATDSGLYSEDSAFIEVTPKVDTDLEAVTITAVNTEDNKLDGLSLANPVKVVITPNGGNEFLTDKSESLGNIVLDKIPNGMTVWYMDNGTLKMATNIGSSTGSYALNPNGDNKSETVNKWLIPVNGSNTIPEIYINAPEHWAGEFNYDISLSVYEQNAAGEVSHTIANQTAKITAVADGFSSASATKDTKNVFQWADLNINAQMIDTDGSEVMNVELTGLSEHAQFRVGTTVLDNSKASWDGNTSKWTISGVKVDDINDIQFMDMKATSSVTADIWTQEQSNNSESSKTTLTDLAKINGITGGFTFDKELSLDFNNIDPIKTGETYNIGLKDITSINLGSNNGAKNELLNLTLQDVLDMGKKDNDGKINLEILGGGTGANKDKVTFADNGNWTKSAEVNQNGYWEYTNTDDTVKVQIKSDIEQPI